MSSTREWYVRAEDGKVYGPADVAALVVWAEDGRIDPTSFVSRDRKSWMPAQLMPELEMKWLVEAEPGEVFGPFNRAVVIGLFRKGELKEGAKVYRLHEFPVDQDPPPVEVIKEVRVEVPVEKIVEKIVEKEVIKEVRVEVPVEGVVEKVVEKVVEVPPSAHTEIVMAEVVEPVASVPPPKAPGSIFGNVSRDRLAALEAAARRELSSASRKHMSFGIFGSRGK